MYFRIEKRAKIETLDQLFEITKRRTYDEVPGQLYPMTFSEVENNSRKRFSYLFHFETAGIFRGQATNWELIPSSYRDRSSKYKSKVEISDSQFRLNYFSDNSQLHSFCEMATRQNEHFPSDSIEQMMLAQHYGIKTPLLDWTRNILAAAYFALDLKHEDDVEKNLEPFIYHLKDERLLASRPDVYMELIELKESSFVEPKPIDRRVERQSSVFSFHPHPFHKPDPVPVDEYQLSGEMFMSLWKLLEGMGFSSSYFFPDYAGLAERIKQGYFV